MADSTVNDNVKKPKDSVVPSTQPKARTKKVAEENNIEATISEAVTAPTVITGPKREAPAPNSNLAPNDSGTVGSRAADRKEPIKETPKEPDNKVALMSTRNIYWEGVGRVSKGYNIVTKEDSEKWLTMKGITTATPEEVATYYGK